MYACSLAFIAVVTPSLLGPTQPSRSFPLHISTARTVRHRWYPFGPVTRITFRLHFPPSLDTGIFFRPALVNFAFRWHVSVSQPHSVL